MDNTYIENDISTTDTAEIMEVSPTNIMLLARKADEMIAGMNKIMEAALRITTEKDWVLIGGNPYLQESGSSKVRGLFGISWRISAQPEVEIDDSGHRTYTFRGVFTFRDSSIEAEGSRSSKDEFFCGKQGKSPDQIDMTDVRMAAYTNCINNGIKRILPGLRNIDIETLERAGLNVNKIKGYTFKTGTKGGASKAAKDSGLKCSHCDDDITQAEASYSKGKFGSSLCRKCQDMARSGEIEL